MKITEIKSVGDDVVDLKEGVIPVHLTMTLDQIVNAGRITNSVQSFVVAGLVEMFKDGGPTRWPRDLNAYGMSTMGTSTGTIMAVRSLLPEEQVGLAAWLLVELQKSTAYETTNPCCQPQMDPVAWMRWVLRKQD